MAVSNGRRMAFKHQYREAIVMLMRKGIGVCPKPVRIAPAKAVGI